MKVKVCPECQNNPHYHTQNDDGDPCPCRICNGDIPTKMERTMNINIPEQEIKIDLEEVAYKCAQGDVIAFGEMLVQFCEHLEKREKDAGYSDLRFFDTVFGIVFEYMSEQQIKKIKDIVEGM